VWTNAPPRGGWERFRPLERSTIATALSSAGYRTGLFGKYLNGYGKQSLEVHLPVGWTTWRAPIGGTPYGGFEYFLPEEIPGTPYLWPVQYSRRTPGGYITDVLVRETREFIEASVADGAPFFAMLSTYAPHGPATPAPRHRRMAFPDSPSPRGPAFGEGDVRDKPRYVSRMRPLQRNAQRAIERRHLQRVRSLQAVDEGIALLIQRMDELGVLDDTYIFFTSDNGWLHGEHRLKQGKQAPYEESIGVPLVVRGPGVPEGVETKALALNTDFAPTFAAFAGTELAHAADGRSLAPALLGAETPSAWRQSVLLDLWSSAPAPVRPMPFHGIRTRDYLYVEYKTGERELYDMLEDPSQLDNAYEAYQEDAPEIVDVLAERLAALRSCAGVACRALEDLPIPVPPREPKPKP
jgi:N-acetylglucosamine-6-sulfatase